MSAPRPTADQMVHSPVAEGMSAPHYSDRYTLLADIFAADMASHRAGTGCRGSCGLRRPLYPRRRGKINGTRVEVTSKLGIRLSTSHFRGMGYGPSEPQNKQDVHPPFYTGIFDESA